MRKEYLYICNKKNKQCMHQCNLTECNHTIAFRYAKNKFKKRKYQIVEAADEKGKLLLLWEYTNDNDKLFFNK